LSGASANAGVAKASPGTSASAHLVVNFIMPFFSFNAL